MAHVPEPVCRPRPERFREPLLGSRSQRVAQELHTLSQRESVVLNGQHFSADFRTRFDRLYATLNLGAP